jgi:ferredoxin
VTRVEVDRSLCISSGGCEMVAPQVFELDDEGTVHVRQPGAADLPAVQVAVRACPSGALSLSPSSA